MKSAIRQRALELGFDACRFTTAAAPTSGSQFQNWLALGRQGEMSYLSRNADKRLDPQCVLPGARSVITLAVSYHHPDLPCPEALSAGQVKQTAPGVVAQGASGLLGVVARYARYRDYHDVLQDRVSELAKMVNQLGGPRTRSLAYVDTGPVLERDLAQRAGLGFVGKHTNLISRQFGNWVLLSEILTTLELDPDPAEKNRCGACTRCLAACPTRAIRAPFELDARRCISYLTIELKGPIPVELRSLVGCRIFGCDDCLAVCPWNRFARAGQLMQAHARPDLGAPELLELLALDRAAFKTRFAGTPLMRAKHRGLLRNVCVALGNVGGPGALPALQRAATGPEPLVAEHALWAIEQIAKRAS